MSGRNTQWPNITAPSALILAIMMTSSAAAAEIKIFTSRAIATVLDKIGSELNTQPATR